MTTTEMTALTFQLRMTEDMSSSSLSLLPLVLLLLLLLLLPLFLVGSLKVPRLDIRRNVKATANNDVANYYCRLLFFVTRITKLHSVTI